MRCCAGAASSTTRARLILVLASLASGGAWHGRVPVRTTRRPPTTASAAGAQATANPSTQLSVSTSEEELFAIYLAETAREEAKREHLAREHAERSAGGGSSAATREPLGEPRLQPHDIPVITLERSQWTIEAAAEAVDALLSHRACAVHVRGFLDDGECGRLHNALADSSLFSNWKLHEASTTSEVDKAGRTSSEALVSFDSFQEYVHTAAAIEGLIPGELSPFELLRRQLDLAHPDGCCRCGFGPGLPMPLGTYRRMSTSCGFVHADTSTALSPERGEFSANIYIRTPAGKGALNVYPAMQYTPDAQPQLSELSRAQQLAYAPAAQACIRAALPLKRTVHVGDGDLVLINTGRFHEVEAYDEGYRLSGQCWVSFTRGEPLYLWV
eukprot:7391013-Prymnesium_polylepis.1